ncbi:UNVERIFIED_CONTAM: FHIPEP family type III secretion protein, partial [Campylobacter lari]
PEPTEKLTVLLYQEPVFSLSIPAQADYLLIGADASVVGDSQTLPNGMGQICWLTKDMAHKAQGFGLDVFAGSQRISALLNCVLLRHMGEFIGVQETRYLMNAMEKNYSELVKELQRQLPINKIAETLQRLVSERVSIRDLRLIFGTLI